MADKSKVTSTSDKTKLTQLAPALTKLGRIGQLVSMNGVLCLSSGGTPMMDYTLFIVQVDRE